MRFDTRRTSGGRIAVSLVVAVFALSRPAVRRQSRAWSRTWSTPSRPRAGMVNRKRVSAHEIVRGMLAAQAKAAQRYATFASGDAATVDRSAHQARGSRFHSRFRNQRPRLRARLTRSARFARSASARGLTTRALASTTLHCISTCPPALEAQAPAISRIDNCAPHHGWWPPMR